MIGHDFSTDSFLVKMIPALNDVGYVKLANFGYFLVNPHAKMSNAFRDADLKKFGLTPVLSISLYTVYWLTIMERLELSVTFIESQYLCIPSGACISRSTHHFEMQCF